MMDNEYIITFDTTSPEVTEDLKNQVDALISSVLEGSS